jgi:hypothetical protein
MADFQAGVTKTGMLSAAGGEADSPVPQVVPPLLGVRLEAPEHVAGAEAKEFGATKEDFYPTELRARPVGKASMPSDDDDGGGGSVAR